MRESASLESTRNEVAKIDRELDRLENGDLAIVLRGDFAAMLSFASNKQKPGAPAREAGLSESLLSQASVAGTRSTRWLRGSDPQGSLVAGAGFALCDIFNAQGLEAGVSAPWG
jgi:hypothetical protein